MPEQDRATGFVAADPGAIQEGGEFAAHQPLPYSPEDFRREINRVKRKNRVLVVVGIIAALVIALVIVGVVVFKMPGSLQTVSADGMEPVLSKGQVVLTEEVKSPATGDVIAYRASDGSVQMKRVVAVAGDWVNVASDGTVLVSEVPLEGNSAAGLINGDASVIASRQVPERSCFVMADNDKDAVQALYQDDAYIAYGKLLGRVIQRLWPITSFGAVN